MLVINGKEVFTTLEEVVDPKHNALLLIDIQNDYVMPGGNFDRRGWDRSPFRQMISNTKRVLEAARHSGVLVVFVQMTLYPEHLAESHASLHSDLLRYGYKNGDSVDKLLTRCVEGTQGWQIVDELTPLPNEVVVRKHRSSAFIGTTIDRVLRSNNIKSVTITGLQTHGCVIATANDALFFDYCPVLLRDCNASMEQGLHDAAILVMSQKMDVADSEDVIKIWASKPFARR